MLCPPQFARLSSRSVQGIPFVMPDSRHLRRDSFACGFELHIVSSGFRIGLGLLVGCLGLGWGCFVHALGLWCLCLIVRGPTVGWAGWVWPDLGLIGSVL